MNKVLTVSKQKTKHGQSLSATDLIRLAEERLAGGADAGQAAAALELLRSAEAKLRQATQPAGKKISIPPHLVAARSALPALIARAHFLHARTAPDRNHQLADLDEAVNRAPGDHRYLLARGAGRLLAGETERACADFDQAAERRPGDPAVTRARALGLLAAGQGRQAKQLLAETPEDGHDANWQRLATLCGMIGGLEARIGGLRLQFPLLAGMAQLAGGEFGAAETWFNAPPVLDRNPSSAEAAEIATRAFYGGAIHFEAGRYAEAIGPFAAAWQLASARSIRLPWVARMAACCHTAAERVIAESPSLAIQYWELAGRVSPGDDAARTNLVLAKRARALAAWREGDLELCAALWRETLQARPEDEQVLKNLALALERLGRKADALGHWRALARVWRRKLKGPDAGAGFHDHFLSLEQRILQLMIDTDQPPNEIAAEFEEALKADPENMELRRQAVDRMLEMDRGQPALKHLELIEKREGPSSDLMMRKAVAQASLRRIAEAMKSFERAIELDPNNSSARRAFLLFLGSQAKKADEREDIPRAIEICERQIAFDPGYIPAINHLGALYFSIDRDQEAVEQLRRVVALKPDDPLIRINVGRIYQMNNYSKEAAVEFERAVKLDSGFDCLHDIAILYLNDGDTKKAFKYFDRAAENADFDQLMDLATHASETAREKELTRYLEKATTLAPDNPRPFIVRSLGTLSNPFSFLLGMKDTDKMEKDLEIAERLARARPEYAEDLEIIHDLKERLRNSPLARLFSSGEGEGLFDAGGFSVPGLLSGRKKKRGR
ncbi:MAG: BTAD domain-containing putative transcriptional regulator [Blastocatellia bacterium]